MASAYYIDRFPFQFWTGDQPGAVIQTTQQFARPGVDDATLRAIGKRGRSTTSTLVSWHASWFAARQRVNELRQLVGQEPVEVVWNNRRLVIDNRCKYQVEDFEEVDCHANVRLIGPGFNLSGGVALHTRWTLLAVSLNFLTLTT